MVVDLVPVRVGDSPRCSHSMRTKIATHLICNIFRSTLGPAYGIDALTGLYRISAARWSRSCRPHLDRYIGGTDSRHNTGELLISTSPKHGIISGLYLDFPPSTIFAVENQISSACLHFQAERSHHALLVYFARRFGRSWLRPPATSSAWRF